MITLYFSPGDLHMGSPWLFLFFFVLWIADLCGGVHRYLTTVYSIEMFTVLDLGDPYTLWWPLGSCFFYKKNKKHYRSSDMLDFITSATKHLPSIFHNSIYHLLTEAYNFKKWRWNIQQANVSHGGSFLLLPFLEFGLCSVSAIVDM